MLQHFCRFKPQSTVRCPSRYQRSHSSSLRLLRIEVCGEWAHLLGGLGGLLELRKLTVCLAVAPAQLLQLWQQPVALLGHAAQLLLRCPSQR